MVGVQGHEDVSPALLGRPVVLCPDLRLIEFVSCFLEDLEYLVAHAPAEGALEARDILHDREAGLEVGHNFGHADREPGAGVALHSLVTILPGFRAHADHAEGLTGGAADDAADVAEPLQQVRLLEDSGHVGLDDRVGVAVRSVGLVRVEGVEVVVDGEDRVEARLLEAQAHPAGAAEQLHDAGPRALARVARLPGGAEVTDGTGGAGWLVLVANPLFQESKVLACALEEVVCCTLVVRGGHAEGHAVAALDSVGNSVCRFNAAADERRVALHDRLAEGVAAAVGARLEAGALVRPLDRDLRGGVSGELGRLHGGRILLQDRFDFVGGG